MEGTYSKNPSPYNCILSQGQDILDCALLHRIQTKNLKKIAFNWLSQELGTFCPYSMIYTLTVVFK